MALNDWALNEDFLNGGREISSASGTIVTAKQDVDLYFTASGAIITIAQNVRTIASGAIITIAQIVDTP